MFEMKNSFLLTHVSGLRKEKKMRSKKIKRRKMVVLGAMLACKWDKEQHRYVALGKVRVAQMIWSRKERSVR